MYSFDSPKRRSSGDYNRAVAQNQEREELFESAEDERIWQLLSVYRDGEATSEEAAAAEALLQVSSEAARRHAFLKDLGATMRGRPEQEPPATLRAAIFAATTGATAAGPHAARNRVLAAWIDFRASLALALRRYGPVSCALGAAGLAALLCWPRSESQRIAPLLRPEAAQVAQVHPDPGKSNRADLTAPSTQDEGDLQIARGQQEPIIVPLPPERSAARPRVAKWREMRNAPTANADYTPRPVAKMSRSGSGKRNTATGLIDRKGLAPSSGGSLRFAEEDSVYSPRPMMDAHNMRTAAWEREDDNSLDSADVHVAMDENASTAPPPKNAAPNGGSESAGTPRLTSAPPPKTRRIMEGKLLVSEMPPDTRRIISGADIRREQEASRLGYDRVTQQNIERHQVAITFTGKF